MAKERLFDLPETKGTFQIRGKVTGHDKDNFYKETKTKTGKPFRRTSFGVTYEPNKTMYINLQGMPQDNVYFSKPGKDGKKGETKPIPWVDRFTYVEDGFRMIGNNIGVTKSVNEKGEYENDRKILTDFDSVKEIADHIKDDDSVFIRGKLEYSSFTNDKGEKRNSVKLVPNQVSLCKSEINFDDEKFNPTHEFTQVIVFTGIDQEKEDDKPTGRFIVTADIVNYGSIEEAEFFITNATMAKQFRKSLSPYNAIKVWGEMAVSEQVDEVESDDIWGTANKMERQSSPVKREYIITGADPGSIDKDTYSESSIAAAKMKVKNAQDAKNDFGSMSNDESTTDNGAWGSLPSTVEDDEDDVPW